MQETIDVTKLSIEQLEAFAYRLIKQSGALQRDIQVVENELAKKVKEEAYKKDEN